MKVDFSCTLSKVFSDLAPGTVFYVVGREGEGFYVKTTSRRYLRVECGYSEHTGVTTMEKITAQDWVDTVKAVKLDDKVPPISEDEAICRAYDSYRM